MAPPETVICTCTSPKRVDTVVPVYVPSAMPDELVVPWSAEEVLPEESVLVPASVVGADVVPLSVALSVVLSAVPSVVLDDEELAEPVEVVSAVSTVLLVLVG
ncbi:hypothetical protein CSO01_34340 [Cellulomonas soli]|uniref:Uncharacterized protein n=1 Tax=Cellulomonas soli TaxID=931535 RepID=A0A512PHM5_9CELL|nr:hypothetical protein CSO01_34340 [Cellulomonas soli]